MYKLILVEDEADVREGLAQEIDWEQCGFEVVAKAENGKEAYELVDRLHPDVIVTDIMMPFMDGLELSKLVRANYPQTKIIILTGFDEFEYAKQAVKLQIEEYVLKPFSTQELTEAIHKVKQQIDEEVSQKENIEQLLQHYQNSLPILKHSFLSGLVTRVQDTKQTISDQLRQYDIPLHGNSFLVSLIRIDQVSSSQVGMSEVLQEASGSLRDSKDKQLQLFAVRNIAEEICSQHQNGIVFLLNDFVVLVLSSEKHNPETVLQMSFPLLDEIRLSAKRYLGFTITLGVGTVQFDLAALKYSYDDASLALDYRVILGNDRIIYIGDVEKREVIKLEFDEKKEQDLVRCLKLGDTKEIVELVDSYFVPIEGVSTTYKDYQIFLLEMLTAILKTARHAGIATDYVLQAQGMLLHEMKAFNNLIEARDWICELCLRVMQAIANERNSNRKNIVDLAKDYIAEHFHESDISIARICQHLHISTGYFSYVFKKDMKTTFVSYLLQIRMETAKELLQTTDLKSFEIAERVGYADPNYFSFCFKKYFGMTPKECRSFGVGV